MRIYAYGARAPVENASLVHDQLRLACTYQRVLVLIERRRRAAVTKLYERAAPEVWQTFQRAQAAVLVAIDRVRVQRTRPGDMLDPDEEMKAEARALDKAAKEMLRLAREAEKIARQAWYDARKKATPKLRRRLAMCDRGAYARAKVVYGRAGDVGLAWGTRLKVSEFVERAAKASLKAGSEPRMPFFDGSGALAVQLQGGLATEDAMNAGDTRFRLEIVDAATWQMLQGKSAHTSTKKDGRVVALPQADPNSRRSRGDLGGDGRAPRQLAIARLRIGSNGRAPVWAAWPIVLHRPLPCKAPIKWVQAHATKIGPRIEWQILVTVDDEVPAEKPGRAALAVNLGWRNLLDREAIRVAYAVGTDGAEEELLVPASYTAGVAHVASLRSIRDRLFEAAKGFVGQWRDDVEAPEWFMESTRYWDRWRSQKHLVRLLGKWRNARFKGDQRAFETVGEWAKKDRHLWFWESDEREKLLRMRKDFYRATAARWAAKYDRIFVTDMDLRDFAEKASPESKDSEGKAQRVTQRLAAPSVLREAIKNACSTRGTVFAELESKYKTQTCNACGVVFAFAAKQDLLHTCECGARWDQDANHCKNLLASGAVTNRPGQALAPSGQQDAPAEKGATGGRWTKRRSRKAVETTADISKSG